MGATMWCKRSLASTLAARSLAVLWLHGGHSLVLASEPAFDAQAIRVDMTIKAGQFHPSPVSMPVGRPVALVFHNLDAELHAFVPGRFLEDVPLHLDGNGTPQFGEKGLERVLIRSGGREDIRFVPPVLSTFEYRCDLPGHQMIGTIVVEEQSTGRQAVVESGNRTQGRP